MQPTTNANTATHKALIAEFSQEIGGSRGLRTLGIAEPTLARWSFVSDRLHLPTLLGQLPNLKTRPLACSQVLFELNSYLQESGWRINDPKTTETLLGRSPTLTLLNARYAPTFIRDHEAVLTSNARERGVVTAVLQSCEAGSTTSTLTNTALAALFADGVLHHQKAVPFIQLAQYTWPQLNDTTSDYALPTLPQGVENGIRIKAIVSVRLPNGNSYFADYGRREGEEKYGKRGTGEGLARVAGTPIPNIYSPNHIDDFIEVLDQVAISQSGDTSAFMEREREATRRITLHSAIIKTVIDFVSTDSGLNFPRIIGAVEDFSDKQLAVTLTLSRMLEGLDSEYISDSLAGQIAGKRSMLCSLFKGGRALVGSSQPSTRSVAAAKDAAYALGLDVMETAESSAKKGETPVSQLAWEAAQGFTLYMYRDPKFEELQKGEWGDAGDIDSVRLSLGGNDNHPFQSASEIRIFMDHFGCSSGSITELFEKTTDSPPTITFIGHTDQKRADKALIRFINARLPHWNVKVIVPEEKDRPAIDGFDNNKISVVQNLSDQSTLAPLLNGSTFVYISNAEATASVGVKGSGQGKAPAKYYLSRDTVKELGVKVLHPLPASGEIDPKLLHDPENTYIRQQMIGKVYTLAAAALLAMKAKERRLLLIGKNPS